MPAESRGSVLIDEKACQAYEAAWQALAAPTLEQFLPPAGDPSYLPTLEELIHIELELAWKSRDHADPSSGETLPPPPRVEDYLRRFAVLSDTSILRRLLEQEYRVRHRYGDQPTSTEYVGRFPDLLRDGEELVLTSRDQEATASESAPTASRPTAWQAGGRIDRYALEALHAKGGMGLIWRAQDHGLGREVALKQLKPEMESDPRTRERFVAEARIAAQLEHPGIVPVYDLAHLEGQEPYYTMKLVRGRTLADEIHRFHRETADAQQAVEQHRLLNAFLAVCRAMAYAHARGVIHRDLKPENIILGDYGETLILDWGLAKVVRQSEPARGAAAAPVVGDLEATQQGEVMGTPVYMSPEQIAGQVDLIDERSDVFSLGAILYLILTGRRPFAGQTILELQQQILATRPTPPRALRPAIPRGLEAMCLKAMARRPERRYPSAADLAADLERFLADEPVTAHAEPFTQRLARWARRHRVLVTSGSVALALLLVSALGGLLLWGNLEQRRQQEAFEHRTQLRSSAEADASLALAEVHAGRFASAVKILDQASERIQNQPELEDLRARLSAQRRRAFRVGEFYRLLDETWFRSFAERDLQAVTASEAGLTALGIRDQTHWWLALPVDDLTPAQQEQLRQDAYEMFHLLASLHTKLALLGMLNLNQREKDQHARAALAVVERTQAFQPSQTIRLVEVMCRLMLLELDQLKPWPAAPPVHPTDQFFFGIVHVFLGMMQDNLVISIMRAAVLKHVPSFDAKQPKETGKRLLQQAINRQPSHYGYYIWLGIVLLMEKDYPGSELAFTAALAVRPTENWIHSFRALPLAMQVELTQDPEERKRLAPRALQNLDRAIERAADESIYWLKASMHGWLDQRLQALDALAGYCETTRRGSDWPDSSSLLGNSQANQRQYLKVAVGYAEKHLQEHPLEAGRTLALARLAQDNHEAALTAAEAVLKHKPDDARARAVRGAVRRQRGQLDQAMPDFEAAMRADPINHIAAFGRAAILEQQGHRPMALEAYDHVLQTAQADWQRLEAHLGRARLLAALGRPAEAKQALTEAHAINFRQADKLKELLFPAGK